MAKVFVDTSAVYALVDRADDNHAAARAGLDRIKQGRLQPLLSNFVVAESHALLLSRLSPELARRWLAANIWPVERVTEADEARAKDIVTTYRDKDFSYTDATSFALMARLGLRTAFAFDPHFRQFGFLTVE